MFDKFFSTSYDQMNKIYKIIDYKFKTYKNKHNKTFGSDFKVIIMSNCNDIAQNICNKYKFR